MTANGQPHKAAKSRHLTSLTDADGLPRERAMKHGLRTLSNAEIVAILLGSGIAGKNVMDIANEICTGNDGHISLLSALTPKEMAKMFDGIGPSKALSLLAALELGRRAAEDAAQIQLAAKPITDSNTSYELMRHHFTGLTHEEFWVLALNNGLKRITDFRVNTGTATLTVVDVRKIILGLLENGATAGAVFHNHPSGSLKPSNHDDTLTKKIIEAARLFDIRIVDHLIITETGFYSYSDNGRL